MGLASGTSTRKSTRTMTTATIITMAGITGTEQCGKGSEVAASPIPIPAFPLKGKEIRDYNQL